MLIDFLLNVSQTKSFPAFPLGTPCENKPDRVLTYTYTNRTCYHFLTSYSDRHVRQIIIKKKQHKDRIHDKIKCYSTKNPRETPRRQTSNRNNCIGRENRVSINRKYRWEEKTEKKLFKPRQKNIFYKNVSTHRWNTIKMDIVYRYLHG